MKYKHIFFDLDRTLWDYDTNARNALCGIYYSKNLDSYYSSEEEFLSIFNHHNDILWDDYRKGLVQKDELRHKRFNLTLLDKGINNSELASAIDVEYMETTPTLNALAKNTIVTLEYLKEKGYKMYILTNGFLETQQRKLKHANLDPFFLKIYSSDEIGVNKPKKEIFHWAVSSINAKKQSCLMIGDDLEVDVKGAENYGIDAVWYNPKRVQADYKPEYEIEDLIELTGIL